MLNLPSLISLLISTILIIIALTIHEFSHALTADTLGDPTPRAQGRVSLNPLRHLDPLGTLMLILVHFGWGKPVQIDPYNFRHPKRDELLVALAGPASNLLLAVITSLILRFTNFYPQILIGFFEINLILAVFNLIPIPPLDGSKILLNLLPYDKSYELESIFEKYGPIILLAALFIPIAGSNLISIIMTPILNLFYNLLLG